MFAKYQLNGDSLYGWGSKPIKMKNGLFTLRHAKKWYNFSLEDLWSIYKK
jgi:hypothetical protein